METEQGVADAELEHQHEQAIAGRQRNEIEQDRFERQDQRVKKEHQNHIRDQQAQA